MELSGEDYAVWGGWPGMGAELVWVAAAAGTVGSPALSSVDSRKSPVCSQISGCGRGDSRTPCIVELGVSVAAGVGILSTAIKLDPEFAGAIDDLIIDAIRQGVVDDVELVSGYRSTREQSRLFADFEAGRSDLPAAEPGTSYHEFALAVDVSVSPPDALESFGLLAEDHGLRWGGRFGDPVHIDAGNSFSLEEARTRFRAARKKLVEVA